MVVNPMKAWFAIHHHGEDAEEFLILKDSKRSLCDHHQRSQALVQIIGAANTNKFKLLQGESNNLLEEPEKLWQG